MLYDNALPRSTNYGNSFDATKYASDVRLFNKHKNIQNAARPWWQAALQFIPFGIGNAISPAIEAGIAKGRNTYQSRLDKMIASADDQAFDYGFDDSGKIFAQNRVVPTVDNPGAKDAAIWAGVGGGVKTFAGSLAKGLGRDNYPHDMSTPQGADPFNSYDPNNFSSTGLPPAATGGYDNTPALNAPQVVANPSAGNMDWASQWNNPTTNFSHGGVMVTGGEEGEDDIALVNARTGQDTGKRVSSGEQIVFSEDTLDALHKAIGKKDKTAVFDLVTGQIKRRPNVKGGMVRGGSQTIDITPSSGNMDWGWDGGADPNGYEEAPAAEYFDVTGNRSAPAPAPAVAPRNNALGDNIAYWAPSAAGNAMDSFRFAYGMSGADTEIPQYHKSADWRSYLNQLKAQSGTGFSPAERAAFQTQQDRQYAADVSNIYNLSGGSNAIALAGLGRANTQQYLGNLDFAGKDAALQRINMQHYGTALGNDVNLDRMIFGDRYGEAKQKEAAGAKLANDAFTNMKDREVVDQFYNPNSAHGKMLAAEVASKQETEGTQRAFMKFLRENPELFTTALGSSGGALDLKGGAATDDDVEKAFAKYVGGGGTKDLAWFKSNHK